MNAHRTNPRPLVLASSSPRRVDLLRAAGYRFEAVAPHVDESDRLPPHRNPSAYAEAMSHLKAADVAARVPAGIVLGADTIVTYRNEIYGKPTSVDHARRILTTLAGTTHQVITGVTLLNAENGLRDTRHAVSTLTMRTLSPDELETYLDSGAWVGKAGAYGVQDEAEAFVTSIEGSFSNVVGLPMGLVEEMLGQWTIRDPDPTEV